MTRFRPNREWAALRRQHLRVYPECRACDVDQHVVVHHVRYRGPRGQSEQPGDLVTLCADCHDALHRELGRTPRCDAQLAWINERRAYRDTMLVGLVP